MSRIGKQPIKLPEDVTVKIDDRTVYVNGSKGSLSQNIVYPTIVSQEDGVVSVNVPDQDQKMHRERWGLMQRLIRNMVVGVSEGYSKQLEVNGVGYKVSITGSKLELHVGFSHTVDFTLPEGVSGFVEKNIITITGVDKQLIGEVAARIRRVRPPEPYKGKGIKYVDEVIRRKAGKQAK